MTVLFIDESKASGYTIVAASLHPRELDPFRKSVRELRKPGQRRVHFVRESDSRRRAILSTFTRLGVKARIYHVRAGQDSFARELCLVAVLNYAAGAGVTRVVLERDDSIVDFDRRILYRELERRGVRDRVSYLHDTAAAEPLLAVPDAIAWSYARGGDWRERIKPLVIGVSLLG